jgi:predicted 3-demethylubiquinone-9 3-methyltransferase (glyoxalase superfamily)
MPRALMLITAAALAVFSLALAHTTAAPAAPQEASMPAQKLTTCLWFKDNAEQAVNFYTSTFKNARIITTNRMPSDTPGRPGAVVSITFELEGQRFLALNGNQRHSFNESISIAVSCETQQEVDALWAALTRNGSVSMCGWLKDEYGVSWQIIPTALIELMHDKDPEKSRRVVGAMLQMQKLDIAKLKQAHAGE